MKVLIIKLSAIGDIICCLPVATALKDSGIATHITWAADKRFSSLVTLCDAVDEVLTLEKKAPPRLIKELGPLDAALDMQGLFKSARLIAAAQTRRKLGYHYQREGARFFSSPVRPDPTSQHIVDQYVDVARALGATTHAARFGLVPSPADLTTVKSTLTAKGWTGTPFILVNPSAGWESKRWPVERHAALAARLHEQGHTLVFMGAPADQPLVAEIQAQSQVPSLNLAGETNLTQMVALISLARVHLGGDTGSSHIAGALGIPSVGLMTVSDPLRVCPYGQRDLCLTGQPSVAEVEALILKAAG